MVNVAVVKPGAPPVGRMEDSCVLAEGLTVDSALELVVAD
jgi:hypothetical protein